jgi:hypothetical protein
MYKNEKKNKKRRRRRRRRRRRVAYRWKNTPKVRPTECNRMLQYGAKISLLGRQKILSPTSRKAYCNVSCS